MISVDWGTKEIFIPKEYTSLVSLSPFEVRELDINQFRLDLRKLESEREGMPHERTHEHNTEVILGAVTLARVVAIINGYTITFEDTGDNYAVDLLGANSNIADVVNLNSVQVRSYNSAGLLSVNNSNNVSPNSIAEAVWAELIDGQEEGTFGKLLTDLLMKSNKVQHTLHLQNELLKNKPNNC